MTRTQSVISERSIAWAIGIASAGRETDLVIAKRLGRGIAVVRTALADLVKIGAVRIAAQGEQPLYEMVPADERVTAIVSDEDELEDDASRETEAERAEALWKKRLGTKRWHDDPRSLAETQKYPEIFRGSLNSYPYTLGGVSTVYG